MKRKLFITTAALLFALMLIPAANAYAGEIAVSVNGQPVVFADQNPEIVDGRTLVPVAGVFQALGFEVEWNHSERQAVITRGTDTVLITVGRDTFTRNGVDSPLDVPAQIINERTMLPIAAVLQNLGYDVDWDSASRTVAIAGRVDVIPPVAVAPSAEEPETVEEPEAVDEEVAEEPEIAEEPEVAEEPEAADEELAEEEPEEPEAAEEPTPELVAEAPEGTYAFPFEFTATDLNGNEVNAASLGEREFFLVYIWGTFCGHCVRSLPELAELHEELGDRVGFIGLLTDFDRATDTAIRQTNDAGVEFINVAANRLTDLTDSAIGGPAPAVPFSILIDGNGNVIGETMRGANIPRLRSALEEALR